MFCARTPRSQLQGNNEYIIIMWVYLTTHSYIWQSVLNYGERLN